jgi:transcriptional regulator with XRE-family HTH domain
MRAKSYSSPRAIHAGKKSPNPVDQHVGARMRARRLVLDMSQTKLGQALGLTFQQIQKYEKGANRVGASRLQQIAHTLQVPVSFFFDGAPATSRDRPERVDAPSPAYVADFVASVDGIALIKAFAKIKDAKLRRRIVDLVDRLSDAHPR